MDAHEISKQQSKKQIDDEQQKLKTDKKGQSTSQFITPVQYNAKNLPLQIQQLQEELFQKNKKLIDAQQLINELDEQNSEMNKEIQQLQNEKALLLEKFESIEEIIDTMQMDKTGVRLIRLENDQFRQDIARLISLLKSTKDYSDILLEEGQHFVGSTVTRSKILEQSINKKVEIAVKEEIFWIPMRAIDIINDTDMSSDQKNELLALLNSIFFDFYNSKLNRHEQLANKEIANLKRQMNSRIPYNGMMTTKKSERTQRVQFTETKSDTKSKTKTQKNLFNKIEDELKISKSIDQSKIFMDGAVWILERIKNELKSYEFGIKMINQELSNKIDALISQEDIVYKSLVNKIFKWITDASDEQLIALKDKIDMIAETTKTKIPTRSTFSQNTNDQI